MKISLEWLGQYLPGPLEAAAAADTLTHGGFPVEVIERVGDDTVIDVEVTSNRGDCLSHIGVARELSALMNRPLAPFEPTASEAAARAEAMTSVGIEAIQLCPHYTARIIRGVRIGPSPDWMRRRLEAVGVRPINNVVDVTNYVMFERGQPLHAFDFDKLADRRIIVRNARLGEVLVSIDGHERKLMPDMLVIADARRPVALAGVMGGRDSEVSQSTVNILLESARFDPLSVRTTARRLAMASDSSYRFERGIDPLLPRRASVRAAQLILQTAGGELLAGLAEAGDESWSPRTISLRISRLAKILGVEIPNASAVDALARLGLKPVLKQDAIEITVPSWRGDLNIEADLIEEVARVIGYGKIPIREEISIRVTPPDPHQRTVETIRSALVAGGYFEAVTVTFVSDALADEFTPASRKLPRADALVRKADARLRPSMIPALLEAVRRNEAAGNLGVKFFEIGSTFELDDQGDVVERRQLGIVGGSDLRDVRGAVELLLGRLDASRTVQVSPDRFAGFSPQGCGRVEWGGQPIGHLGRISSAVGEKLDLRSIPVVAELEMSALLGGAQQVSQLRALPRFPAIRRDLSLIVPESSRFEAVRNVIEESELPDLEDVEYVGSYRGKPLEKGTKSITISLVFRSKEQTLTSEAVDASVKRVIDRASRKIDAILRT